MPSAAQVCGIAGFIDRRTRWDRERLGQIATSMSARLVHRGPDDGGHWVDADCGIGLGHRRLSIVDLSAHGHQPMVSENGRYVIVFNGEIYNFRDLAKELADMGHHFRGHSDTEVLLHSIEEWGLATTLKRLVGMFAFGLWDRRERVLHLARDRMGEKPLYYGWQGECLMFASELKALVGHPDWQGEVNRDSLTLLLRHNYIPAPHSIYRGIYKLSPGSLLSVKQAELMQYRDQASGPGERGMGAARRWWPEPPVSAPAVRIGDRPEESVEEFAELLGRSVAEQMVADVPVGALLSGGIDSSTVVALAQARSTQPIRTFTVGFGERDFDEARHAHKVAQHLGTEHTELRVSAQQALKIIPELPRIYDEPFADASQIPTCLVARLARQQVTVALSGDGGDELFCGYSRYRWARQLWALIGTVPGPLRAAAARILGIAGRIPGPRATGSGAVSRTGQRLLRVSELLGCDNPGRLYCELVSQWKSPRSVVLGAHEPATAVCNDTGPMVTGRDFYDYMMRTDQSTYLPDDILVKVDRASMASSLEMRVPLLDHRIVEFARQLPLAHKLRAGKTKWIMRELLGRHLPEKLFDRPKMGFAVPLESWLRGPLREWAGDLLEEGRLRREGYFDPEPIQRRWREHLAGKRDWQYYLWDVLMFQAWLEHRHT